MRGGRVHEVREQLRIAGILLADFNRRDHVRFDATHQMDLHPLVLLPHHAIFMIEPADKARGREARGIDGKIRFNHFERQATLDDQASKDWCQDQDSPGS